MNLYITNMCSLRCPYCFAQNFTRKKKQEMSLGNFKKIIRFLQENNEKFLRFEGGEPTDHPLFRQFIDYAIKKGFSILVFSNGLFSDHIADYLYSRRLFLRIVWNINDPHQYRPPQWRQLNKNLRLLSPVIAESTLGINIYSLQQNLDYMYALCKKYRPRYLRYVFAHRMGDTTDTITIPPEKLHYATKKIVSLTRKVARKLAIISRFDCGFIPCIWTDKQLGVLARYNTILGKCSICPGIDPDLYITHCFHANPLNRKPLSSFKNKQAVYAFLEKKRDSLEDKKLFAQCTHCTAQALGTCDYGCLGDRLFYSRTRNK